MRKNYAAKLKFIITFVIPKINKINLKMNKLEILNIGSKIRKLREANNMSQEQLALQLEVSQTKLHNLETGNLQKVDFLLMDKICEFFDKDFSYFLENGVVNNVKQNRGQISCENFTINNFPEKILEAIQNLIDENKEKGKIIENLQKNVYQK